MSNVTLTIGGRHYTVACADGEEAHIADLGALIDGKLAGVPGLANQSEPRTLLFAALLLADEVFEARSKPGTAPAAPPATSATGPSVGAEALEMLAEGLERLATRLEKPLTNA